MGDLVQALLLFAGSAVVVIFSGVFLAKYGDALADLMGWGRLWVGTVLVAVATSLPELGTNITAAIRDEPELAGGNILGANMVNMFTLAMVALVFGGAHFFRQVAPEQRFLALAAISLTALAVLLGAFHPDLSFLSIGLGSVIILAVYLGGVRLVYATRPQETSDGDGQASRPSNTLPSRRKAWLFFGLASLGVIVAAPALTFSVEQIAETTGLATGFLGVVAVALVTTMPEASTTVAAVRLGATDLAVGGLYGSCAFNVLILAVADPFYRQGVLVSTLETGHLAAGLVAVLLMALGLSQILLRGRYRYAPVAPVLVVMGLVYVGGLFAVYILS
jgi:cation:H+ antiporter